MPDPDHRRPTRTQDGYSRLNPLKEGYIRKGGTNAAASQI